jgi:glycosyltransferase involved in cell wall biosynthesis
MLDVCLVTRGSPDALSGGHLYHRHLLEAAPACGVSLRIVEASTRRPPPTADVVVVDSIAAGFVAPWIIARRPRRWAAIAHQQPGGVDGRPAARAVRRALDGFVYRRCQLVLAVSPLLADALVAQTGVSRARLRVVTPGCDLPPARHARPLRNGRLAAFVNVANWLPNKGIVELLDAFARVPRDTATLHLIGRQDVDVSYSKHVLERVRSPFLAGRVIAHGPVPPAVLAEFHAGADAFVAVSFAESYGTACAEALASGLPVVGWRLPHTRALVTDGVDGCLVPARDNAALAAALTQTALDDVARRRLAEGAKRSGPALPTWEQAARRFFAAVASVAAIEPAHDRSIGADVDTADAGVFHERAPGDV